MTEGVTLSCHLPTHRVSGTLTQQCSISHSLCERLCEHLLRRVSGADVRRYLIQVAHVALVPGDAFGAPQCVRISYAASMETLQAAMERIQRALDPSVYRRRQAA